MLEKQDKITIEELKTYLYSLDEEKTRIKEERTNAYTAKCEANKKKVRKQEIQKINKTVDKEYEKRLIARNQIQKLLEECDKIPKKLEKLTIVQYMISRAEVKSSGNAITRATKRIGKRYNEIVGLVEEKIDVFPNLDNVEEIDFSVYKLKTESLQKAKEKYQLKYTDEERMALIQNELDIIQKAKIFNTTPMPHEILKNSDKDIQSKMQKFNNIRQKRLRIIETMEADYLKMQEPKEKEIMVDDAIVSLEIVNAILTKSEYNKAKNGLLKKKKKIYKSTSELRNLIKTKEKKTGIVNYNIQEARYARMESLRAIISEATKIIKANAIPGAEEQLEKLKVSYEREKQFAAVIEQLEEEAGNNVSQNTEVKAFEEQIRSLENKISSSKKITKEQEEKIAKAKKELVILWKMEIDTTISKKKETLELPEVTDNRRAREDEARETKEEKKIEKGFFARLKRTQGGKHACV